MACDMVYRKASSYVLRIYGVRGLLLKGLFSLLFKDVSPSVCMNRELRENMGIDVGVIQMCVMSPWCSPWLFIIRMVG